VSPPEIYSHPYNCIGWILVDPSNSGPTNASGFLIGPSLVLTSAHNLERNPELS